MKIGFPALGLASLLIVPVVVQAVPLGANVTISDNNFSGSGWYSNREDNETETNPDTINSQQWDLEGMFLNGTMLTLVGGFDFKNGTDYGGHNYAGGDIFIDTGANSAVYGQSANGNSGTTAWTNIQPFLTPNAFGYDYAIDIGAFSGTPGSMVNTTFAFNVVQLSSSSIVTRVMDVAASNPWTYSSGGNVIGSGVGQYGLLSASEISTYGLLADGLGASTSNLHFYMTVDLATIGSAVYGDNIIHYTVECGNDDLMGRSAVQSVPDEVPTLPLLGVGMGLLVCWRGRRSA